MFYLNAFAKIMKKDISKYLRVPPDDILRNTSCTPAAVVREVMSQIL